MPARVLSVGNCGADNAALQRLIETHFDAQVAPVADGAGLRGLLDGGDRPDLVLVNRIGDRDGGSGLELIAWIHANHPQVVSMLLSNYADAQQQAVENGARPGFGKSALGSPETRARLADILPSTATTQP